jgi:PAS domain S-box-containing protein
MQSALSVLHVEEDEVTREPVDRLLRAEGLQVTSAATGAEALRRAAEGPNVILLDMHLSDMSGPQVCLALKSSPATAAIPIIALGGHHIGTDDRVPGLESGADLYLIKPVEPLVLLTQIKALARTQRAEEALRENEERLRMFVEQMPAIVWTTDTALHVTSYTGAGLREVNAQGKKSFGMSIQQAFPNEPRHLAILSHHRALAGESIRYEVQWGGRWWSSRLGPLRDGQGQIIGCLGIAIDVTEQKTAEEERERLYQEVIERREQIQLLSRRLMESQEAERGHVARELHDEMGQVLTTVHLSLEALRGGVAPADLHHLNEPVQVVDRAIAQVRGRSLDLRPAALDLLGLETALRGYLHRQTTRSGVAIELDSDLGTDVCLRSWSQSASASHKRR